MANNPDCSGAHCAIIAGEVRLLPYGGGGNLILCRSCHAHEIQWRSERNKELAPDAQYDLPPWESLKIYQCA